MSSNLVGWFEIPVTDIYRAKMFYDAIFDINIQIQDFGVTKMGLFPYEEDKPRASGALMFNPAYKPSENYGVLIYFTSEEITKELSKIEQHGGKVIRGKTQISPEYGFMALFIDCEGNRIALHSKK